jgi:hypothetical protein
MLNGVIFASLLTVAQAIKHQLAADAPSLHALDALGLDTSQWQDMAAYVSLCVSACHS